MKTYVEVKNINVPAGGEFMGTSYPGPGLYQIQDGRHVLVYSPPGSSVPCCMVITALPTSSIGESKSDNVSSANDVLKAIALFQKPELAVELCK